MRILWEVALGVFFHSLLVFLNDFLQSLGIQFGVQLRFLLFLLGIEDFIENGFRNFQYDIAEHLDKPAVGVVGKTRIVAACGQRLDTLIVQAEIEDRVHHAGHGELRSRTHTHQERILARTQFLFLQFLEAAKRRFDLLIDVPGHLPATAHVLAAGFGLNGETRRHGQTGIGHFGQARPLATQLVLHLAVAISLSASEEIDVLGRGGSGLRCMIFRNCNGGHNESLL